MSNLLEHIRLLLDVHTEWDDKSNLVVNNHILPSYPVRGISGYEYPYKEYIAAWRALRETFGTDGNGVVAHVPRRPGK